MSCNESKTRSTKYSPTHAHHHTRAQQTTWTPCNTKRSYRMPTSKQPAPKSAPMKDSTTEDERVRGALTAAGCPPGPLYCLILYVVRPKRQPGKLVVYWKHSSRSSPVSWKRVTWSEQRPAREGTTACVRGSRGGAGRTETCTPDANARRNACGEEEEIISSAGDANIGHNACARQHCGRGRRISSAGGRQRGRWQQKARAISWAGPLREGQIASDPCAGCVGPGVAWLAGHCPLCRPSSWPNRHY